MKDCYIWRMVFNTIFVKTPAKPLVTGAFVITLSVFLNACGVNKYQTADTEPQVITKPSTSVRAPAKPITSVQQQKQPKYSPKKDDVSVKDKANIAILLPLSGKEATLGQRMLNAATLAMEDAGHKRVALLSYDTKGTVTGARAATGKAITQGADIILGPVFGNNVKAVQDVATQLAKQQRQDAVPILAFSNDVNVAAPGVYPLGYQPTTLSRRVLNHAKELGIKHYAALLPANDYGRLIASSLAAFATENSDVYVIKPQTFTVSVEGMNQAITALGKKLPTTKQGEQPADMDGVFEGGRALENKRQDKVALLAAVNGAQLNAMIGMLKYHDVDLKRVKLLGNINWRQQFALQETALRGALFASPAENGAVDFAQRYQAAFGTPPMALESIAYDATALAAILANEPNKPFSVKRLTNRVGFAGTDGLFRLRPGGGVEREFAVFSISGGGFKQVADPAAAPTASFRNN